MIVGELRAEWLVALPLANPLRHTCGSGTVYEPESPGQRFHGGVYVAPEQRIAAAVAAGGTVLDDKRRAVAHRDFRPGRQHGSRLRRRVRRDEDSTGIGCPRRETPTVAVALDLGPPPPRVRSCRWAGWRCLVEAGNSPRRCDSRSPAG